MPVAAPVIASAALAAGSSALAGVAITGLGLGIFGTALLVGAANAALPFWSGDREQGEISCG